MCFVHVEFYPTLLFRANYDPAEMCYKAAIRLPPGKHSISFLQAKLRRDEVREKLVLYFAKLTWKVEAIQPLEGPFNYDGRIENNVVSSDSKSVGGNFFNSSIGLTRYIENSEQKEDRGPAAEFFGAERDKKIRTRQIRP